MEITTKNTKETFELGKNLSKDIKPGVPVFLYGDLGAGKTELIKGICSGLGFGGRVLSPTFQLVREYRVNVKAQDSKVEKIYHIDLYRLESGSEIKTLGLEDYFANKKAVILLEWADRLEKKDMSKQVVGKRVEIRINIVSENERKFDILNV